MFEQTLLTHPASARKTGALAASFLAQTAIVGVLLVGPLLYTQVLPMVQIQPPMLVFHERFVASPLEIRTATSPSKGAAQGLGPRRFLEPTRVPTGPIQTEAFIDAEPAPAADYVPGVPAELTVVRTVLPTPVEPKPVEIEKPAPVSEAAPVRIGVGVLAAKLVKRIVPAYPALARQIRVSGSVHLLGIIAKDGRVQNLRVIDGHPLLRQAALDAVSQWVYSPTILNGQPVEVEAPIEVNFALR